MAHQLLEITTRPFLRILSERYGKPIEKLSQIPVEIFDEWKEKGFDWIWMMGVWKLGKYGLNHDRMMAKRQTKYTTICPDWKPEDIIGSPYAIVSYTVNEEIGDENGLKWFREQLKQRGMKLMLDFVPNHTAFDAPEIELHREFYIYNNIPQNEQSNDKNETPVNIERYEQNGIAFGAALHFKPWTDVAQLNYMNEEMRKSRIEVLLKIASQCDGIRCDVADSVLNQNFWNKWEPELVHGGYKKLEKEFWEEAISSVKKEFPNCIFLAEANFDGEIPSFLQNESTDNNESNEKTNSGNNGIFKRCGFDYIYDRFLMLELHKTKQRQRSVLKNIINNPDIATYAHFLENHDEPRSLKSFGNNVEAENAGAVFALTLPGLRFFNQDQWKGYTAEIGVHLRRAMYEEVNQESLAFYNKLFELLKMDVMRTGQFSITNIQSTHEIFSWKWTNENTKIVIFINLFEKAKGKYVFDEDVSGKEIIDFFTGKQLDASLINENKLSLLLRKNQFLVIKY
ncbi:Alpha amylase, catalytic domain containing protein [Tritrichomonas foetus]|uniref:Alpha amylase, catalytic domain containing protein n=1 Tax=Tritrichomonas foetus TaxID=1144522 RepID=A0A1J4J4J8_9EUKA|nr:Alpha amylase, catalytic domain containing protein [Tritrichomonas foetus]|eukprot:OHS94280.1 Alpha amylase, catalytic domain containing protein [Tritrichomonas foetus]